ncbi:MAG: DUF4870 domain-containing protein [Dehalococcoidia bacterium]|nr:DUF4870 domain-containing protein [Dehalococcoidia bacterium]
MRPGLCAQRGPSQAAHLRALQLPGVRRPQLDPYLRPLRPLDRRGFKVPVPSSLQPHTPSERFFACAAHGSIALSCLTFMAGVLAPYVALLVPLVLWTLYVRRSRWVAFNALEALLYQIIVLAGGVLLTLAIFRALGTDEIWLLSVILLAILFPFSLLGLWAARRALQGGVFHYPLLGLALRRLAGPSS